MSSLCPEKNLVIWCHMSHPWLSHLPFIASTSSSSFTLLRHKNIKHNRYNQSISENTPYIPHITSLQVDPSLDMTLKLVVDASHPLCGRKCLGVPGSRQAPGPCSLKVSGRRYLPSSVHHGIQFVLPSD